MARKKIFIIAGEASGDLLGAELMQEIKTISTEPVEFSGIGGPQMTGQGLTSLFPMTDLSIMGLAEVLKHLPKLISRYNETIRATLTQQPDVIVTIDAPDFCLRVAKKIKKLRPEIKLVHYVAPTVWAWRPGRAKKIAQYLDGLLCLFPFEPPYFEKHGLKAKFVGHPIAKTIPEFTAAQKSEFYTAHGLNGDKPILCLLPGSRVREAETLGPIMLETVQQLKKSLPELQVIIPTMPHLIPHLSALEPHAKIFVPKDNNEKYLAFASATAALHASGTVALELALCAVPMVTIYKLSNLSAWIAKRVIKTPYANLVNILLRHPVVPELIQEKATPEHIIPMVQALLTNETIRQLQIQQLQSIRQHLTENAPQDAARFVLGI